MKLSDGRPKVSVVVVCYEMANQREKTLWSRRLPFRREIETIDYEIILMEDGSAEMMDERLQEISPNLRYVSVPPDAATPRPLFEQLGGMDERYTEAGGGFVNLDFYALAPQY